MNSDNNFKIAGNFRVNDWKELRDTLSTVDVQNTEGWDKAFNMFKVRVETRFLNPINEISRMYPDGGRGEGFSVVALQCILIEFFEAFYHGKIYKNKNPNRNNHQYNNSYDDIISKFLNSHLPFSKFFCSHGTNPDDTCEKISTYTFYNNFRCGLLHEAATKGKAVIRTEKKDEEGKSLDPHHEELIWKNPSNGQIILYRTPFQKALENYIQDYKRKLMTSLEQREAFCRKMNELCQL